MTNLDKKSVSASRQTAARRDGAKDHEQPPGHDHVRSELPAASHASRPYRRAHRDRGAETRQRLIEAALDVFGRYGFDGATTRQIAKEAGANLAAIVYHFGSKEALHIAVAEHILGAVLAHIGPILEEAGRPDALASPEAARATLKLLLGTYVDVLLGSADAERWARFIVREQMNPSAAFDVIYRMMTTALGRSAALVAAACGRPEDDEIRVKAIAIFGQVLIFRVAQAVVLRRMEWSTIGDDQRAVIKRIVFAHVDAILQPEKEQSAAGKPTRRA